MENPSPQSTAPEPPVIKPPQEKPKSKLVPLLVFLLFLALATAGYFAWQYYQLKLEINNSTKPSPQPTAQPSPLPSAKTDTYEDQVSCETSGGNWQKDGLAGQYSCLHDYADGGKECQSSDQCLGDCIVTSLKNPRPTCQSNDSRFGCFSKIEDFETSGSILCRD